MKTWLKKFIKEEDAPTMVEYGLLVALIAIIVIGGATILGNGINTVFTDAGNTITGG